MTIHPSPLHTAIENKTTLPPTLFYLQSFFVSIWSSFMGAVPTIQASIIIALTMVIIVLIQRIMRRNATPHKAHIAKLISLYVSKLYVILMVSINIHLLQFTHLTTTCERHVCLRNRGYYYICLQKMLLGLIFFLELPHMIPLALLSNTIVVIWFISNTIHVYGAVGQSSAKDYHCLNFCV